MDSVYLQFAQNDTVMQPILWRRLHLSDASIPVLLINCFAKIHEGLTRSYRSKLERFWTLECAMACLFNLMVKEQRFVDETEGEETWTSADLHLKFYLAFFFWERTRKNWAFDLELRIFEFVLATLLTNRHSYPYSAVFASHLASNLMYTKMNGPWWIIMISFLLT